MEARIDFAITAAHLALTLFNALGWAVPKWRRWHLFSLVVTFVASIVTLGRGCPITLWQRAYRESHGLPAPSGSFLAQLTGWPESVCVGLGAAGFLIALGLNLRAARTASEPRTMPPGRPA